MPELQGYHHVALTVCDIDRSKQWYMDVLGVQPVMEGEEGGVKFCVTMHSAGFLLGLREFDGGSGDDFTPQRTGLDHVGFGVGSRTELEKWQAYFDEKGVTYTPIMDVDYGHVLNFKDPDNIAFDMIAMPGS